MVRIPVYAFHDGFGYHHQILEGALPINLAPIEITNPKTLTRFLSACPGWIRYKPLYVFLTDPEHFESRMEQIETILLQVLPQLADYFKKKRFLSIQSEFRKYCKNVKKHEKLLLATLHSWNQLIEAMERVR